MAKKQGKLKVYRTVIGFHDAYVAAPSQKAALAAWGTDRNLFARGIAEPVTDPELARQPLANPGSVIKRLRGTAAEQFATLAKSVPRPSKPAPEKSRPRKSRPPSRAAVEAAEQALEDAARRYETEERALADQEEKIRRERRALTRAHEQEIGRLQSQRDKARQAYQRAVDRWEP